MSKITRFLLISGLAVLLFASCSKKEQPSDKFTVIANPSAGASQFTLQRLITIGDTIHQAIPIPMPESLTVGDSLILTATVTNGYTFINWLQNGKEVSTNPSYKFVVRDGMQTCRFEARFGLDYAIQVIPPIDEVMPADLIAAMGPYLHFGDNPPRIDTCFSADSLRLARFIHNLDDTTTTYYLLDSQYFSNKFSYHFFGQHRGIADSCQYERAYGDISYGLGYFMFENASARDSIYIMGNGDAFTVYYHQTCKKRMEPDESLASYISDYYVQRRESIIMTGRVTPQGIADFHLGMRVEGYSEDSPRIGQLYYLPAIHDIFIYDFPNGSFYYDTSF